MCQDNKWWVMEQQPGPVNWAHWNPIPKDGMVRLWTWQAMAHGCDLVSYFRWRQAPFAQEQMHAGLLAPDSSEAQGAVEVKQLAKEIKNIISHFPSMVGLKKRQVDIAVVFDYESIWMAEIQPQGLDYNALELVFRMYSSLRSLGLDVDIVSSNADLDDYRVLVVASQWLAEPAFLNQLQTSKAQILVAPRAGSKTRNLAISEPLPPGSLTSLVGAKVLRVGSLPPSISEQLYLAGSLSKGHAKPIAQASRWIEDLQCIDAEALWVNSKGSPIVTRKGNVTYSGAWLADADWQQLMIDICTTAGLHVQEMPQGLRLSQLGDVVLASNFSNQAVAWRPSKAVDVSKQQLIRILLGEEVIPPQGIAIWQVC
jgi:beta-galactosidase